MSNLQNFDLFDLSVIMLLIYIIGISYTSLLIFIINFMIYGDKYNLILLVNSLFVNIYGYTMILFSNLLVLLYYIIYNYNTIKFYYDILKKIIDESKVDIDILEEFETLNLLIKNIDKIKMYIFTNCNSFDEYKSNILKNMSESSYGKLFLKARNDINIIMKNLFMTVKYILEQTILSESIKHRYIKKLNNYKYIIGTNFSTNKKNNDDLNKSLYDDDFIKYLYDNNDLQISNHMNQMNEMMQNFSNIMKSVPNIDNMKTIDRKKRRLFAKANKKKNLN